ncbi:MAG: hypothetical protein JNN20_10230 [Betaproteobacteria bacterium]|nr:hypothetical protein [Betaproteobacteria bacterium]
MPTMEISINGHSVGIAGGDDFDVISFGVISGDESLKSTLLLTGYKKATNEQYEWLRALLASNDNVGVVVRRYGQRSSAPYPWSVPVNNGKTETRIVSPTSLELAATSEFTAEHNAPFPFNIFIGKQQQVFAAADIKFSLQVTVTWHRSYDKCKVEIWSAPIDGVGRAQFHVALPLDWDQPFELKHRI